MADSIPQRTWSLFSRYGHVLICIAENPSIRMTDLARELHVSERQARNILNDLEAEKIVVTTKVGRANQYMLDRTVRLRHPLEETLMLEEILQLALATRAAGAIPPPVSQTDSED